MAVDITALFCCLDHFCKVFADWQATGCSRRADTPALRQAVARRDAVHRGAVSPFALQNVKVFYLYGIGGQYRACLTSCRTMTGWSA